METSWIVGIATVVVLGLGGLFFEAIFEFVVRTIADSLGDNGAALFCGTLFGAIIGFSSTYYWKSALLTGPARWAAVGGVAVLGGLLAYGIWKKAPAVLAVSSVVLSFGAVRLILL